MIDCLTCSDLSTESLDTCISSAFSFLWKKRSQLACNLCNRRNSSAHWGCASTRVGFAQGRQQMLHSVAVLRFMRQGRIHVLFRHIWNDVVDFVTAETHGAYHSIKRWYQSSKVRMFPLLLVLITCWEDCRCFYLSELIAISLPTTWLAKTLQQFQVLFRFSNLPLP